MSLRVPKGWQACRIGDIAREISVRNRGRHDIPVLSITKHNGLVLSHEYFSKSVYSKDLENYKIVRKGQYAYASIHLDEGSIDVLRYHDAGLISPMYTVFEIYSDNVFRDFIFPCLKRLAVSGRFNVFSQGGVNRRKSISFKNLSEFKITLPPLEEQRAIAEILGSIEEGIVNTNLVIAELDRSRVEITRALQGPEQERKWAPRSIGSLLTKCQYGLSIPLDGEGHVAVLRMPDVAGGRVLVDPDALKSTEVTGVEIASWAIHEGDILFNRTNSQALVGKSGVVRKPPSKPIVFASYLIRLVTKDNVNPYWLNAVLNLPRIQERLKTLATPGVSQWNINANSLKRFLIPVPSKAEQDRFAEVYEAIEHRLECERQRLAAMRNARTTLAQELFAGRLRMPESIIARHRGNANQAA